MQTVADVLKYRMMEENVIHHFVTTVSALISALLAVGAKPSIWTYYLYTTHTHTHFHSLWSYREVNLAFHYSSQQIDQAKHDEADR